MPLDEYRRKRDFTQTPEPSGDTPTSAAWKGWTSLPHGRRFCVQMHRATRMHWDVRLEHNGVLLSWAVPRGPSLAPADKRMAIRTEDHPVDYGDFEGIIPSGYGMGTVVLWDVGTFEWVRESAEDAERQLTKGDVKFALQGSKISGEFALVRIGGRRPGDDANAWLMIKKRDESAVDKFDARDLDYSVRTGRTMAEIAASGGGDPRELRRAARPSRPPAVARKPVPSYKPMLATKWEKPFSRDGWLFEIKYDGVRALITVDNGSVSVTGRSGRDETARYPEAQRIPRFLRAKSAVLDAEVVSLDADGRSSFERLQGRINSSNGRDIERAMQTTPASFACFDILRLDGKDLTSLPLRIRKKTLRDVIEDGGPLLFADHVEREGEALLQLARDRELEGIVAKSADSTYHPGIRSRDWLKIKAWQSQSCVICGYTAGKGRRTQDIGALILGVYEEGALRWCGHVGTGMDRKMLQVLRQRLDEQKRTRSPITPPPVTNEPATWVKPTLVCEVRHAGVTSAGMLRHPVFAGLRDDIRPEDCTVGNDVTPDADVAAVASPEPVAVQSDDETEAALAELRNIKREGIWEVGGRKLRVTNLDKVFWPESGYTKRDLIEYYVRIAPYILPFLRDRASGFEVYPDGITGKRFWRKTLPEHAPEWITTWTYSADRRKVRYAVIDEVATLAWAANSGAIDIHPWHSRIDTPDEPDWAVFDLDPFEPATFADVCDIAKLIKVALDHYKLHSVLKVSGQTGLQIYVPLRRGPSYREVREWVEEVGRNVGKVRPDLITWEWTVKKRTGQIRIDYTQNILNKTLAAPYSVRPAPGAPVSVPVAWEELDDPALRPNSWTIRTVFDRLKTAGDLFSGALAGNQALNRQKRG
jgi:bifunctional non-homologous end joining protein LigD